MSAINEDIVPDLCARLASTPPRDWRGLRLVHVGSALEYGAIGGSLREDATPAPTTDYGRTKLAATRYIERIAAATGLRAVTARLFTVYGSGEHPGRLLPSLMALVGTDKHLKLSAGLQRRDFTYVEDVVDGLLRLATAPVPPGSVVNIATGRLTSVREFAEAAASILSIDPAALAFGALPMRAEEMWHDEIDITRLRDLTSWVPSTTIADGIRRSWEWQHVQR
jgi:nucleoside-diphosphate-sugar epimerase